MKAKKETARKRTAPAGSAKADGKPRPRRRSDGLATEARLLEEALRLFRRRGFEATTMRDIAAACGTSLGAAYHYFPSKEAIVATYYAATLRAHEEAASRALSADLGLRERLRAVYSLRLDTLRKDRRILGALVRVGADPESPLSVLSAETAEIRERSIALFARALEPELPEDARRTLAPLLWAAQLALLIHFVRDRSPGQQRTAELVDGLCDLIADFAPLAAFPGASVALGRLGALFELAGIAAPGGARTTPDRREGVEA